MASSVLIPSFEHYTNGSQSPVLAIYYMRALSIYGLQESADELCDSMEKGFLAGRFHGPYGTGREFSTWIGADSGYEGTFIANSPPLYAIAVNRGFIKPTEPEWYLEYKDLV